MELKAETKGKKATTQAKATQVKKPAKAKSDPNGIEKHVFNIFEKRAQDKNILMGLGLSEDDANILMRERNKRTESITIRLSKNEVEIWEFIESLLKDRGYINTGKSDTLVFLMQLFEIPPNKQGSIEFT